jgi:hypothetical protein
MKKQILSVILAAGILASCSTTRTNSSSNAAFAVPRNISNSFATLYPTATDVTWGHYDATVESPIDWELAGWPALDSNAYMATYNVGSDRFYTWYDANGAWIGSTYNINDVNSLSSTIRTMLTNKYPGYAVVDVDKAMWKDQSAYEVKLKKDDSKMKVWVDMNGNVLKEVMK